MKCAVCNRDATKHVARVLSRLTASKAQIDAYRIEYRAAHGYGCTRQDLEWKFGTETTESDWYCCANHVYHYSIPRGWYVVERRSNKLPT